MVRHAEVHNPKDIVYGRLPGFGLSTHGRAQAEATARFLSARPVRAVYSSPLLRARQTAAILRRHLPGVLAANSRALVEVRTSYQGSPNSILQPGFSFYEPRHHPDDESIQEVFARMRGFLHQLTRRHAGQTVVVVSHADPIAILRVGLEGLPLSVFNLHRTVYPERASVTQVLVNAVPLPDLGYFDISRKL